MGYDEVQYWVEFFSSQGRWKRFLTHRRLRQPFDDRDEAIDEAVDRARKNRNGYRYRVIDSNDQVVWDSGDSNVTSKPQEETVGDITAPLHIPRDALIGRLEEVKAEAEAKRQAAQAESDAKRQTLLDKVGTLSRDQVANLLDRYVDAGDLEKFLDDVIENKKYVTLPLDPTGVESVLDRTIRVFKLASDTEITVSPTDSIYAYL